MENSSGGAADRGALDALFDVSYAELRRLARHVRRTHDGATLSPTALVNECWIKLCGSPALGTLSPLHFRRVAARAMRQVLVEAARRRRAGKRGGVRTAITFDESSLAASTDRDLLALDAALDDLARISPRQASMVEARFFGGLDAAEIAELLGVSAATVLRDWRSARAWLAVELRRR